MSSSLHKKKDNKKKDILILGKSPTQELEHLLTAENFIFHYFYQSKHKILFKLVLQWSK